VAKMFFISNYISLALVNIVGLAFGFKMFKWLLNYVNTIRNLRKIKSVYRMIPFVGNAHQLKTGPGWFFCDQNYLTATTLDYFRNSILQAIDG
jgi:hypothetical protein